MIITSTKCKTIITRLEINKLERFIPFEIRLPANVSKVTGLLVTASGSKAYGTVSFQANDKLDVFYVAEVIEHGIAVSDEASLNIEDTQFESNAAWVTGYVPRMKSVNVEGDTAVIHAWYQSKEFDKAFLIRVYIECALAEELQSVNPVEVESEGAQSRKRDILDPVEIHL